MLSIHQSMHQESNRWLDSCAIPTSCLGRSVQLQVVRIIIPDDRDKRYNSSLGQFKTEFFASETCKWTERVVLHPKNTRFCVGNLVPRHAADVFNGMLYFLSSNGFVLGLDPYSNDDNCITPPASPPTTSTAAAASASAGRGGCGDDGNIII